MKNMEIQYESTLLILCHILIDILLILKAR